MKQRIFFLLSFTIGLCLSACAGKPSLKPEKKAFCSEWKQPDSMAYNKLGKRLSMLLFAPKAVKCYHLIGKEKVSENDVEIEKSFVRDAFLATLGAEEIAVLQYALLKPAESYERDSVRVMSPYMPILEFNFTNRKDKVHVVVSLSDMTWTVIYDDKKQFRFNYANKDLITRFCNYYLSRYKSKEHE